ncbi:hypothetical protein CN163_35885, partial [Sinorhizobium meliloti]
WGRHHLGIRGRLFLGIGGRDHFGTRGRIASEFAAQRRASRHHRSKQRKQPPRLAGIRLAGQKPRPVCIKGHSQEIAEPIANLQFASDRRHREPDGLSVVAGTSAI